MKKFRCLKGWKRWNPGDVIDEYEYNRLPYEIKKAGNFIEDTPVELLKGYFATVPKEEQIKIEDVPEVEGPTIKQFFDQTSIEKKVQQYYDTATPDDVVNDLKNLGADLVDISREEPLEDFVADFIREGNNLKKSSKKFGSTKNNL